MARSIEIRKAFSFRLREALNTAGVHERDHVDHLIELTGVGSQLPAKWLNGLTEPTRTTMSHIALHLGVRPEWLLNVSGEAKKKAQ